MLPPPRPRRHDATARKRLDFDDVSDDEPKAPEQAEAPSARADPRRGGVSTACAHQFHTACVAQQAAHDRAAGASAAVLPRRSLACGPPSLKSSRRAARRDGAGHARDG